MGATTTTHRPRRRRLVATTLALVAVAACSGGDKSINQAGQTTVAPTVAPSTAPGDTTVPGSTTAGPTTTAVPEDTLPDCPTDALASAAGPVEITFWHGLTDVLQTNIEALAKEYNDTQTKVKVEVVAQDSYENVIDNYLGSGQSGRPDVAQMPEYTVQTIVDTGAAVPVGKCISSSGFDTSPFLPGALSAYATGGVQWAMPFNVSVPVLFYNRKVFTAAGLDPDRPPTSLAEVREYSQKIVDTGAASYGIALESGFDSGGGWVVEQWFAQAGELYCDNDNGRTARATQVLFNSDTGVEILTDVQSLVKDGLAVYVGDNASNIDGLLKLADSTEPAAMTIATSASLGGVLNVLRGGQFPQLGVDDVGIGPLPGPGGGQGALVGGASMWITDSGDPARIAAAWDFVSWMAGAAQQSKWAAATGYIALRDDALALDPLKAVLATDPRFAVAGESLQEGSDAAARNGPIIGPLREVRGVTAQAVAAILQGADVKASLDAAKATADGLITSYNTLNPEG